MFHPGGHVSPLIPAKAGIQGRGAKSWVPAFAGTSGMRCWPVVLSKVLSEPMSDAANIGPIRGGRICHRDRLRRHHRRHPALPATHRACQAECALVAHRADAARRRRRGGRGHHHRRRRRSFFVRIGGFGRRHRLLPLLIAVILIAAVGAADDIRPIGVAPRFLLQALSVALVILHLAG